MCRCCLHCTYLRFRLMYCALKFCASIHSQLLTEMVKTGYLFALLARSFLEPTHLIGALRMFFDHSHTTRDYVRVRCIDDLVNDSDLLQTVFPTQNTGSYFSACKASLIDSSRRRLVKLDVNLLGTGRAIAFRISISHSCAPLLRTRDPLIQYKPYIDDSTDSGSNLKQLYSLHAHTNCPGE